MRRTAVLFLFAAAAVGYGDRLITIPTARKLPVGTVRYELRLEPGSDGQQENLLGVGISPYLDGELRTFRDRGGRDVVTGDLAYNYIAAIQGLSPGFSLGVQDIADRTPEGRRFFVATTFRQPASTINGDFPMDITLGVLSAKHTTPYVGVLVPFSKEFHFLAEHDGERIGVGAEFRPTSWLNLRAQEIGSRTLFGFQATTHF